MLQRIKMVLAWITWPVLAVGLVNHFAYEFLPPGWEPRLLMAIYVLVALYLAGQLVPWLAGRLAARRDAGGPRP